MHTNITGGMAGIPSIVRGNCSDAGTLIANGLAEVQRGQPSSIPIGCDVCVKEAQEIWLTIVCPTNADSIPNVTVTISWRDEKGNELQGDGDTLLVQTPGKYRCIADFGGGNVVSETTDIGCKFIDLILEVLVFINLSNDPVACFVLCNTIEMLFSSLVPHQL